MCVLACVCRMLVKVALFLPPDGPWLEAWLSSAHKPDSCAAQGNGLLTPLALSQARQCQQQQLSVTAAGYCSIYKFALAPGCGA